MNLFFPFHAKDQHLALDWVRWAEDLGGNLNHALFLHPARDVKDFEEIKAIADRSWKSVEVVKDYEGATGWPMGANACMRQAAQFFWVRGEKGKKEPWLFCETDAIFLVPDCLDQIENGYRNARRPSPPDGKLRQIPFMGAKVVPVGDTPPHMSGVAVYPWDAIGMTMGLTISGTSLSGTELAFDIASASDILPLMHATKLIQHVLSTPDGQNPTFPDEGSLGLIQPEAVLFHRNKDGTLIARLREKQGWSSPVARQAHNLKVAGLNPAPCTTRAEENAAEEQQDARIKLTAKVVPTTIAGQFRSLCEGAAKLIDGNTGRRTMFHAELRKAGLLGPAKKKGKRK